MAELDLGKVVMDSYNDLDNKPKINEVELSGNKTLEDLGIQQLIDAVNVSRLSKDVFAPYFETLEDFVVATATDVSVPHFGRMRINTENWGFGTRQIRYLIAYMRAYTEGVLDVLGSGIFWDDTNTMWHVAIHGSIGNLHIQYYKIEPNQIPTNNLLATVAGTPLDAVQGKVLNDKVTVQEELDNIFHLTVSGSNKNISKILSDAGIDSDLTFQENMELLKNISVNHELKSISIFINSNSSAFNTSLPVSNGGILEVHYPKYNRRIFKFYSYRTADVYVNYELDGTYGTWQKLVTETELNNILTPKSVGSINFLVETSQVNVSVLKKTGNICSIQLRVKFKNDVAQWEHVAKISSEFAPGENTGGYIYLTGFAINQPILIQLHSSGSYKGSIQLGNNLAAETELRLFATYML